MPAALIAACCAAVWGCGDFCGGKATQRANALAVTVLSQVVGLPVLVACVVVFGAAAPGRSVVAALGWGAVAGVAGFAGILLLYQGLAQGFMSVVAPVSAVTAAVLPLALGLLTDRRPALPALIGVGCAITAIGLVSTGGGGSTGARRPGWRLVALGLASGVMFGAFFTVLGRAGGYAMMPLVGVRIGSLAVGFGAVAATGTSVRLWGASLRWSVAAGVLDILANAFYLAAAGRGVLAVIAPIAALYPVSTVLLALAIDRERVRPAQLAGLGLAATALVLVAT